MYVEIGVIPFLWTLYGRIVVVPLLANPLNRQIQQLSIDGNRDILGSSDDAVLLKITQVSKGYSNDFFSLPVLYLCRIVPEVIY